MQYKALQKNKYLLIPAIFAISLFLAGSVLAQSTGQILLESDKQSAGQGELLKVTVSVDTGEGNKVNSYQAILDYPQDKLDVDSINTDASPFNMALEAKGENGKVTLIRGSTTSLTGKNLAAVVSFKAKGDVNASEITVNNGSAIIRSSDNTNILPGSTVQNQASSGSGGESSVMEKPSWSVSGVVEWIKNFFLGLFN